MKRLLLGTGLLLLLIPAILLALHNVSVPIWYTSISRSIKGIAIPQMENATASTSLLDSFVMPLPPQELLEEYGVSSIQIVIEAPNSSITVYKVPIDILRKFLNLSKLRVPNASGVFQYLTGGIPIRALVLENHPEQRSGLSKMLEAASKIATQLKNFRIAEGIDYLAIRLSSTGNSSLLIIYAPNADTILTRIAIYVRLVRHLDTAVCMASIALGATLLALGIALNFRTWKEIHKLFD